MRCPSALLEKDPFHALTHRSEHFVGNGVELLGESFGRQVVAEDFHAVAFATGDVCHVDHAHIHTDVAHIGSALSVDQTETVAVAETAIEPVGVTDGDGGDARRTIHHRAPTVAHGGACGDVANLQNGGAECGHVVERAVVDRIDAVEAQTEAAHVEMPFGETLDARRVADMT